MTAKTNCRFQRLEKTKGNFVHRSINHRDTRREKLQHHQEARAATLALRPAARPVPGAAQLLLLGNTAAEARRPSTGGAEVEVQATRWRRGGRRVGDGRLLFLETWGANLRVHLK